jgi:hypothetical protein
MVITPAVFLYAAGYKLGGGFNLHKTGMLIISSKPENSFVTFENRTRSPLFDSFLKNNKKTALTPAKIKGLLPGEYEIKISKDNYWDWQRIIHIEPGRTAYLENVRLLRKSLPLIISGGNFSQIDISPDKKTLIASGETVNKIDLKNDDLTIFNSLSFKPTDSIDWTASGKKAIIGGRLFDLDDASKYIDLEELLGKNSSMYKTHNKKDDWLFYVSAGNIMLYDFSDKSVRAMVNGFNGADYLAKDNNLHYLASGQKSSEIISIDIQTGAITGKIELPPADYEFINKDHQLLNIYEPRHSTLRLIDPANSLKPIREILSNVNYTSWSGGNNLVYVSDFEIFMFDLRSSNKKLVARLSEKINSAAVHPGWKYIIYSTEKSIYTIETEGEYRINKLVELNKISHPVLDAKGEAIYFNGAIGNQTGLYKIAI